ncbi:MAG: alpha/beta fold hydrolase [Betaproteobacteria bacterium]|nr:alpha/beta fold hydrolase [Betaproteobacteria bacterium]
MNARRVDSSYRAPWWLPGGHLQTIAAVLRKPPRPAYERERWDTPDGDFVDVDWAGDPAAGRLLVLFHGLEGDSDSHYARSLAHAAVAGGWRFALPHFRGCSGEPNRLPRAYHSGDSGEVEWMLARFAARAPALYAAGVSLGGNMLLKWLGERGAEAARRVRRAVAVSAPMDLAAAGDTLDRGLNRRIYTRAFLATMKRKSLAKLERFPALFDARRTRAARTLRAFDDVVTAPLHGFRDTDDYWTRASSAPWLARIRVPTLVLNAQNDPFLPHEALERAVAEASSCVVLESPATGGHVGFLEGPFPGRLTWLPRRILEFLASP